MIRSFGDRGTEAVFNGLDTRAAQRACPTELWKRAQRRLSQLDYASTLEDLRLPSSNRLHALKGDRKGQHSIRINDRWRVCFVWRGGHAHEVEIVDYH